MILYDFTLAGLRTGGAESWRTSWRMRGSVRLLYKKNGFGTYAYSPSDGLTLAWNFSIMVLRLALRLEGGLLVGGEYSGVSVELLGISGGEEDLMKLFIVG